MPGAAEDVILLDSSAALALLLADHESHESAFSALAHRKRGLSGHATFEVYSVLTRLPFPARTTPAAAQRLIARNFPHSRFLSDEATRAALEVLAGRGIAGGAVYDGLVALTAAEHGLSLATRDRRARRTYDAVGARIELLA